MSKKHLLHISPKKQRQIQALPAETQKQLLDGQVATLQQHVYEIASQQLISVWGVNLLKADTDYIFANEVRQVQAIGVQS